MNYGLPAGAVCVWVLGGGAGWMRGGCRAEEEREEKREAERADD